MASQTHPHLPSVCPFQAALLDQPQHIVACCISNEGYNQTHLRLNFSVVTGLTAFILARQLAEAVGIEPTLSGLEPDVLP
jgi:hypothetical protein